MTTSSNETKWVQWHQHFEESLDQFVEEARALVAMDTPSSRKDLTEQASEIIVARLKALGAEVRTVSYETCGPTIIARWQGRDSSLRPVLLVGHYDTVWPDGEAGRRPFTVDSQGRVTGPGTYDMKGGIAIGLQVIHQLAERNELPDRTIVMALNADEELGSAHSQGEWEELGREAAYALVLEPASRVDRLWAGRKGTGIFRIHIEGVPSHAGADHERGVSAIQELAHQVQALHALTDYSTGTTINVGLVSGGIARNVVAPHAEALVDLRATDASHARRTADAILALAPVHEEAVVTVVGDVRRPPMPPSEQNLALFEQAALAATALGMELSHGISGGASDGNFTASVGAPTLDGLGVVGDGAHAYDEWFDLSSVPFKQTLVAALLHYRGEGAI